MQALECREKLQGQLLEKALLAEYTSWRVGGAADYLYMPADLDDLAFFLRDFSERMPVFWLGLGSNVLIRDQGIEGIVIVTQGHLNKLDLLQPNNIRIEAGVSCAQAARQTARMGLMGLEFMAGIPGTVGGALCMNAGCYGGETWKYVDAVETINRHGEKKIRSASDFKVSYRHVEGMDANQEWFVAGHFLLAAGDKTKSLHDIKTLLEKRNHAQPTGLPNCGSVFRNPLGDFAARLIEAAGLKNMKIGGAYVSEKHANFIINDGTATAEDIETLILRIQSIVAKKYQINLIPEIRIVGRKG